MKSLTVFKGSKIPIVKWFEAIWIYADAKHDNRNLATGEFQRRFKVDTKSVDAKTARQMLRKMDQHFVSFNPAGFRFCIRSSPRRVLDFRDGWIWWGQETAVFPIDGEGDLSHQEYEYEYRRRHQIRKIVPSAETDELII